MVILAGCSVTQFEHGEPVVVTLEGEPFEVSVLPTQMQSRWVCQGLCRWDGPTPLEDVLGRAVAQVAKDRRCAITRGHLLAEQRRYWAAVRCPDDY